MKLTNVSIQAGGDIQKCTQGEFYCVGGGGTCHAVNRERNRDESMNGNHIKGKEVRIRREGAIVKFMGELIRIFNSVMRRKDKFRIRE